MYIHRLELARWRTNQHVKSALHIYSGLVIRLVLIFHRHVGIHCTQVPSISRSLLALLLAADAVIVLVVVACFLCPWQRWTPSHPHMNHYPMDQNYHMETQNLYARNLEEHHTTQVAPAVAHMQNRMDEIAQTPAPVVQTSLLVQLCQPLCQNDLCADVHCCLRGCRIFYNGPTLNGICSIS